MNSKIKIRDNELQSPEFRDKAVVEFVQLRFQFSMHALTSNTTICKRRNRVEAQH